MESRNTSSDKIRALASNIIERNKSKSEPYILFLGAGASLSSGCASMMQIVDDVLDTRDHTNFENWESQIKESQLVPANISEAFRKQVNKEKRKRFFEIWKIMDSPTKYALLKKHLSTNKQPSKGYKDLVHLIQKGYFRIALTTNIDTMLEKTLTLAGWIPPEDFIKLVNRKDSSDEIKEQLSTSMGPFKIVKLHGTLESPLSYAFAPEEVFEFEKSIKPLLSQLINQSLIIVGYSGQDRDLDELFEADGKEVHFISPHQPEAESRVENILKVRGSGSTISGESGKFDNFFQELRACLDKELLEKDVDTGPSIEDFLHDVGLEQELRNPYSRFKNLPTLYVKPKEYDDICSKLEKDHTIFIIGEPHLGKTYTAFYILWEYYRKGYEVKHVRHEQLIMLLHQHNNDMKALLLTLFTNTSGSPRIIHFDDPFGETMERRTDKFVKSLDDFLEMVQEYDHLRVIVTSRINVYEEAMAEFHDPSKVEALEKDIRVHTSYPISNLLDVLHRYVNFYKPQWSSNTKISEALEKKLPEMLPAPHNIEFFVRTSQNLQTLDEVVRHVENCKVMITALAEWMWTMPDYEQIFVMWLEICSTASILFPGDPISKVNVRDAYTDTLAYLFRIKKIDGIPTLPFSSAREKFDMIILETKENQSVGDAETKLDFVHPSYHEAFWAAVEHNAHFGDWWQILKQKIGAIMWSSRRKVDRVQLAMIERYGRVNRDLNQLLVICAESKAIDEQIIALSHMLERPKLFESLPQFSNCYKNIIRNGSSKEKIILLKVLDKSSEQLNPDLVNSIFTLSFSDPSVEVRSESQRELLNHFENYVAKVGESDAYNTFQAGRNLREIMIKNNFLATESFTPDYSEMFSAMSRVITQFLENRQGETIGFRKGYPRINREGGNISLVIGAISAKDFSFIFNVNALLPRRLLNYNFAQLIMFLTLLYYPKLSQEKKRVFCELSTQPEKLNGLRLLFSNANSRRIELSYVRFFSFNQIDDSTLVDLLDFPDFYVQYSALKKLLSKFETLNENNQSAIYKVVNNPPGIWVGGAMGILTRRDFENRSLDEKAWPSLLLESWDKKIVGALVADMVCNYSDSLNAGLQTIYKKELLGLVKDKELITYALNWIAQLESLNIYSSEYWIGVRETLAKLSNA